MNEYQLYERYGNKMPHLEQYLNSDSEDLNSIGETTNI